MTDEEQASPTREPRPIADLVVETAVRAVNAYASDECPARLFAAAPDHGPARAALAIIEHLSEAFEQEDPERAVADLGKVCVHAADLAATQGLAIGPILELARALTQHPDARPQHAAGRLARVVNAVADPIAFVDALALCIARGLVDCEVLYDLTIDVAALHRAVEAEMSTAPAAVTEADRGPPADLRAADFDAGYEAGFWDSGEGDNGEYNAGYHGDADPERRARWEVGHRQGMERARVEHLVEIPK